MEGWRDGSKLNEGCNSYRGMMGWRDSGIARLRDVGIEGWRDGGMEGCRDGRM